jgi:antirestriction protein ArdC
MRQQQAETNNGEQVMSEKQNIREEITNNIIAMMEKNTGEWIKPFAGLAARRSKRDLRQRE